MKNIVFDLGGVVFWRDPRKCEQHFIDFFSFVREKEMPFFWNEYDRGTRTLEQVLGDLEERSGYSREECREMVRLAIDRQETIEPTLRLIQQLKAAGYTLYVLSNMSKEFIAFLRQLPVYSYFDGEVVSCEEGVCKPEPAIYRLLLDRYSLTPAETLFIDDRPENVAAAEREGIVGHWFDRRDEEAACQSIRQRLGLC